MARLGGEVMRRPAVEVEQEIAAAQEAERKAEARGPQGAAEGAPREDKEDAHAKVEELKSKFHRTSAGAPA